MAMDEFWSIRREAAYRISPENEQLGINYLDKIIFNKYKKVFWIYQIWITSVFITIMWLIILIISIIYLNLHLHIKLPYFFEYSGMSAAIIFCGLLFIWPTWQYWGRLQDTTPIVDDGLHPELQKFMTELQSESESETRVEFTRRRKLVRERVSQKCYRGRLAILLFADYHIDGDKNIRDPFATPNRFWLNGDIKIRKSKAVEAPQPPSPSELSSHSEIQTPTGHVVKKKPIPGALLDGWWNALGAGREQMSQVDLHKAITAAYPQYTISRDRVRQLAVGRKRGPKPIGGNPPA